MIPCSDDTREDADFHQGKSGLFNQPSKVYVLTRGWLVVALPSKKKDFTQILIMLIVVDDLKPRSELNRSLAKCTVHEQERPLGQRKAPPANNVASRSMSDTTRKSVYNIPLSCHSVSE